jgi:hypothetical protein
VAADVFLDGTNIWHIVLHKFVARWIFVMQNQTHDDGKKKTSRLRASSPSGPLTRCCSPYTCAGGQKTLDFLDTVVPVCGVRVSKVGRKTFILRARTARSLRSSWKIEPPSLLRSRSPSCWAFIGAAASRIGMRVKVYLFDAVRVVLRKPEAP